MNKIISNLIKTVASLTALPIVFLLAYDTFIIRPHLDEIEGILSNADPEDANPPKIIRDLVDADVGSPYLHATRLVTARTYSITSQGESLALAALWSILLPVHFDKNQMYGLYITLSYNGTDYGLSNFSRRAFGKSLEHISPIQAATLVAFTNPPIIYNKNNINELSQQASMLLEKSGHAP